MLQSVTLLCSKESYSFTMFTILFGIHFALRAIIDWICNEDNPYNQQQDGNDLERSAADLHDTTDGNRTSGTHDGGWFESCEADTQRETEGGGDAGVADKFAEDRAVSEDRKRLADPDVTSKTKFHSQNEYCASNRPEGEEISGPRLDSSRKRESSDNSFSLDADLVVPIKVPHLSAAKRVRDDKKFGVHVEDFGTRKREFPDENSSGVDEDIIPVKIAHLSAAESVKDEEKSSLHLEDVSTEKQEVLDENNSGVDEDIVPVKIADLSAVESVKDKKSLLHVEDISTEKHAVLDENNSSVDEDIVPVKVAHLSAAVAEEEPFDIRKVHGFQKMPFLSDEDTVNFIKHSHTMFIMRGLPGSGKSTLVKCLQEVYKGSVAVCSADEFFRDSDGLYKFDSKKLSEAHNFCQKKAEYHCKKGTAVVIIDNTNIQRWAMGFYMRLAQHDSYYHVFLLEPQTPWRYNPEELAQRNDHDVDLETISKKLQSLKLNLYRPLYYGWFLCKEDSAMLVKKSRGVLKQCLDEVTWPDLSSQDVSQNFTALEDILSKVVISYSDPRPMLHCTTAYLARRSKDPYHTEEHVVQALGRKYTLVISGFVYSRQAISARVDLNESASDSISKKNDSGLENVSAKTSAQCYESISKETSQTSSLLLLYVKDEEEILRERFRDVHTDSPDSDKKHALFQHGNSAHVTISYGNDCQAKMSGENILNVLENEFFGKVKKVKTSVGTVSAYGKDLFQIQLIEPFPVNCLFQGFYSSRG